MIINPYVKFSHVMGKWIGAISFEDEMNEYGKQFHNKDHFYKLCGNWDRSKWTEFEKLLDEELIDSIKWRNQVKWEEQFTHAGRNFVFVSMGFECNTYIPFLKFQELEKQDSTGLLSANLLESVIDGFQTLVNS